MTENSNTKTVVHYIADGKVCEYNFNFRIFEAGDIDVYFDEILIDAGYSVSINEDAGGKVIFMQPPANGTRITIIRNLDIKRTSDFQEGGAFRAKVINYELDYQVATLEQLDEKINRSMIYPPYAQSGVSTSLPLPSAGKALVWNQEATALTNSSINVDNTVAEVTALQQKTEQSSQQVAENLLQSTEIMAQILQSASETGENAQKAQEAADKAILASFGNIGDVQYTIRTEVPSGGAWCDGAEYTQEAFPQVYQMLVDGKINSTDYETFENSVSTNGSCGFFGLNTDTASFRVPLLKDVYVKAGQAPLMFCAESLPNIEYVSNSWGNGVTTDKPGLASTGTANWSGTKTKASLQNPAYQDGAKVNPDHVVYRAYVVLYSSAAEASVAQAQEFMSVLGEKANADFSNISSNIDYVVESSDNYIKYKSGKLIQWGYSEVSNGGTLITLYKPYKVGNFIVSATQESGNDGTYAVTIYSKTTTSFYAKHRNSLPCNWITIGQGA